MSWIGEVGQWVGNDGSTLVAGALGAGAALLGGLVGRRRTERREDRRDWREARHVVYSEVLQQMDTVFDTLQSLETGQYRQLTTAQELDDWRLVRQDARDELKVLVERVGKLRLIAAGEMYKLMIAFLQQASTVLQSFPEEWVHRTPPPGEVPMDDPHVVLFSRRRHVYLLMLQQLGLVED